jgi:glycosyltransferase involved in cell wall biosynthesis
VAGGPPEEETGYWLVALLAAVLRPRHVDLLDHRKWTYRRVPLARYLAAAAPSGAGQVAVAALSMGVQAGIARVLPRVSGWRVEQDRMERLLYVRPMVGIPTAVGGSVTHTHEVVRALVEVGVDVEALTTDPLIAGTAGQHPDVRWTTLPVPRIFRAIPPSLALGGDLVLVRAGLRSARAADAVYQRHTRFSLAGALLGALARRPFVVEYNSPADFFRTSPAAFSGHRRRCEQAVLQSAARIVVVSDAARRLLVAQGVAAERIVVNPNGVDVGRFQGGGAGEREALGISDDEIVLGFVGSFGPWHGAPVLAEAFARLAPEDPRLRLLLIGDGEERPATAEILETAGVADRAIFVGNVAPERVARLLDAADVLVSPHVPLAGNVEFFGSPTKLFEYMAAGQAIVASSLGQIGDILEDGRSAVLVEPGSADDLVRGLLVAIGDPELRGRLGAEARRAAETEHSWHRNATRLTEIPALLRADGTGALERVAR